MSLTPKAIYMDANATLPLKPQAKEAMVALMEKTGNPSSIHGFGRTVRSHIEAARETIGAYFGVQPAQVIFTSGGSEANNCALNAFKDQKVMVSAIEHLSVLNAAPQAIPIPCSQNGTVDVNWFEGEIGQTKPDLVSVMYANNETGVLQPLSQVVTLAQDNGIYVHTDGVQALGKYALTFEGLGVDYLSISAHKIGGPQGVGALIVSERAPVQSLLRGGGQERRRRAGTENALGIVGFAAALEACGQDDWGRVQTLRDSIELEIGTLEPESLVIPNDVERLPNTSLLRMPGVENQKQLMGFDLQGIAVSAGSACSSGKVDQSHVTQAMGLETNDMIRVSLGPHNTKEEAAYFVETWKSLYTKFK